MSVDTCHGPLPSLLLFDETKPSIYPDMITLSYSIIQLYSRLDQRDTLVLLPSPLKK